MAIVGQTQERSWITIGTSAPCAPKFGKVYLAGPIFGCSDDQANKWRQQAKTLFSDTIDPMERDYRGREDANVREIVELDKRDIDRCDTLLVWFSRPSVGTSMEALYAWDRGKRIIVVNDSGNPLPPWLTYHSHKIAQGLHELIEEGTI
jgi:nucleoside 2-deoxyribosyltransferase